MCITKTIKGLKDQSIKKDYWYPDNQPVAYFVVIDTKTKKELGSRFSESLKPCNKQFRGSNRRIQDGYYIGKDKDSDNVVYFDMLGQKFPSEDLIPPPRPNQRRVRLPIAKKVETKQFLQTSLFPQLVS